jgi:hypothetical protein
MNDSEIKDSIERCIGFINGSSIADVKRQPIWKPIRTPPSGLFDHVRINVEGVDRFSSAAS